LAFALGPTLPGLAYNVNTNLEIGGAIYIADFNFYFGFFVASITYVVLSLCFPAKETLVPCMIESTYDSAEDQPGVEKESVVTNTEEKGGL
jgi:NCS1 family nucleobase:cation symporter-1